MKPVAPVLSSGRAPSRRSIAILAAVTTMPLTARAAPTVDGTLDAAFYGAPVAVQKVQTQFGDSNAGNPLTAGGSELDAAYARVDGTTLHLFFAGNLESNFNKLELFLDVGQPGQHTIINTTRDTEGNVHGNVDVNFNALARMGANPDGTNISATETIGPGLAFDAPFQATHYITVGGSDNGNGPTNYQMFADMATLPPNGGGVGQFLGGSTTPGNGGPSDHAEIVAGNGVVIALNNSNTAGVTGGTFPVPAGEHPEQVGTGFEIAIPLAALGISGNLTDNVRVTAYVSSPGHDFLSNQVLGALVPAPGGDFGNLAEVRNVNFANIAGDQYFVIHPGLPGDANLDGVVNRADIDAAVAGLQTGGSHWAQGDFNGDGRVSADDFAIQSQQIALATNPPSAAVPEPAAAGLAVVVGVLLRTARRRRS